MNTEQRQSVTVTINGDCYSFRAPEQSGAQLKQRSEVPLEDVLFRNGQCDDEIIPNDGTTVLAEGDVFFSQPAAKYGDSGVPGCDPIYLATHNAVVHVQPKGWRFLVFPKYELPNSYEPRVTQLLVKLPPQFPTASPDMFWCCPRVRLAHGGAPQATSFETLLGERWQRFSWHLQPGQWVPGVSDLRSYMRCIRCRFEQGN